MRQRQEELKFKAIQAYSVSSSPVPSTHLNSVSKGKKLIESTTLTKIKAEQGSLAEHCRVCFLKAVLFAGFLYLQLLPFPMFLLYPADA